MSVDAIVSVSDTAVIDTAVNTAVVDRAVADRAVADPASGPDGDALRRQAIAVLRSNWERGHTVPSRQLYPHQWSWDSAFIAIGWARVAPARARQELESLLDAQWADGRVPQIVFNPAVARDAYFPGPDFWRSRSVPGAPARETSGLVQPPVHAVAAWEVYRADPAAGRAFLERVYPRLCAQHEYLRRDRGDATGLAVIVHPWESGLDNSPAWDAELARVPVPVDSRGDVLAGHRRRDLDHVVAHERPTEHDYARYVALAQAYRDHGYRDAAALPEHRFVVTDPLFNALLAWSEEALAAMADVLGAPSGPHRRRAVQLRDALLARHYDADKGCFFARGSDGRLDTAHTVGGLVPLVLDLPGEVVDAVVRTATGPRFGLHLAAPIPSFDRASPGFDPGRYWRGPAWLNTGWLVLRGLRRHGRHAECDAVRGGLLDVVRRAGFREYFDPHTGAGHGSADFSWSAALTLDLLADATPSTPQPRRTLVGARG